MIKLNTKHINIGVLFFLVSILSIISFPINPLVLLKVLKPYDIRALWYTGWIVWVFGMTLIGLAYFHIYIRKTKGLINHGIYKVIRHPLYLGWALSVFITNIFANPHWIFIITGILGVITLYLIAVEEERDNIKKFGNGYKNYIKTVPRINIILGLINIISGKR